MRRSVKLRTATGLLLTAVVLRAVIPIGYMPTAMADGLLFEMCPSAVPAALLAAMAAPGSPHADSAEHHSGHHGSGTESGSPGAHFDDSHCPVGQALSALVLVAADTPVALPTVAATWELAAVSRPVSTTPIRSRSRDPPA